MGKCGGDVREGKRSSWWWLWRRAECVSKVGRCFLFFAEALRFKKREISGIGCGSGEWISLVDVGEKGMSE